MSGMMIIYLPGSSPTRCSHYHGSINPSKALLPYLCCSGWGLPCLPNCFGSGELLPRRFTVTAHADMSASVDVYSLLRFPTIADSLCYKASCSAESGLSSPSRSFGIGAIIPPTLSYSSSSLSFATYKKRPQKSHVIT